MMKLSRAFIGKQFTIRRTKAHELDRRTSEQEMKCYMARVQQMKDDLNALFEDLNRLRAEKSKVWETFSQENNEMVLRMIGEVRQAREEIDVLEREMGSLGAKIEETSRSCDKLDMRQSTESLTKTTGEDALRAQQEAAKVSLEAFKEMIVKLKEQLADFHKHVNSLSGERWGEKHKNPPNNTKAERKKEWMKMCDTWLDEL